MKETNSYFLICRLKKDDLASLEEIYKQYYSKLFGISKKFGNTSLEADDFVQQTFLKLWEDRKQLRDDVLLDKQLYVICKQLILNHLKRERKLVSNQDFYMSSVSENTEHDSFSDNRKMEKLSASIEKMPPKRKEIFILHKIENLTYNEISKYLNISKKTIANHIYLASDFLKKEFQNNRNF